MCASEYSLIYAIALASQPARMSLVVGRHGFSGQTFTEGLALPISFALYPTICNGMQRFLIDYIIIQLSNRLFLRLYLGSLAIASY